MKTTVYIEGMHCKNCMAKVEKSLSNLEGVASAKVNLAKGFAVLKTKAILDQTVIKSAVDALGYVVTEVK